VNLVLPVSASRAVVCWSSGDQVAGGFQDAINVIVSAKKRHALLARLRGGLAGLAELPGGDLRDVRSAADSGSAPAALALRVYGHRLRALTAAMNGLSTPGVSPMVSASTIPPCVPTL